MAVSFVRLLFFLGKFTTVYKKESKRKQNEDHLQLRLIIFPSFVKRLLEILRKERMKLNVLLLKS